MQAFVSNLYQIIWSTKYREPVLEREDRQRLYGYLWETLKNKKCEPFSINGVEDHLHIVTHIHQNIALSKLVKDLKLAAHELMAESGILPNFTAWQRGYAAFSYHVQQKPRLIRYVNNQEAHHAKHPDSLEEVLKLLEIHKIPFKRKYVE